MTAGSPAFGEADLTNCERELIHLAGSIQPHGLLVVLAGDPPRIRQISSNSDVLLGRPARQLLTLPITELGGELGEQLVAIERAGPANEPVALRCRLRAHGKVRGFDGSVHRIGDALIVELEPQDGIGSPSRSDGRSVDVVDLPEPRLVEMLGKAIQRFSTLSSIGVLADAVVRAFRDLIGYDRVMVYKFDPDGHGKVIAEARDPRLEPLLGHHYPASDIPQRARELYVRNRLRVLVDVDYAPSPLEPRLVPGTGEELDMSMCYLRSMSPLHLQYLKNMGVTATVVVSLVREGRLWGLVACHHYAPRNLRYAVRAATDLLAEVASTRIAAIENYAHAQVAMQARRLEQRLIEATSTEGDWRLALFRNPRTLLQPLDASAAALFFEGEVLTAGEAPSTPELRALMQWINQQPGDGLFVCSSIAQANPELETLTPTASGVLAVKLSTSRPEYLMWFRKEQLQSVTWAGDPTKPVVGNDPRELSPRRSFAAWSEIVRGTALPWSSGEIAVARAFGASLIDIIVQINAVRLLIAEHQLSQIRQAVASSREPIILIDAEQQLMYTSDAFLALTARERDRLATGSDIADLFTDPVAIRGRLVRLAADRQAWRGELALEMAGRDPLPVSVRAEVVTARDGSILGFFLILEDLTDVRRAADARLHLEQSLSRAAYPPEGAASRPEPDGLIGAILTNASLAAMDIADGTTTASVAPLLQELETSTRRAADLYALIRNFSDRS